MLTFCSEGRYATYIPSDIQYANDVVHRKVFEDSLTFHGS